MYTSRLSQLGEAKGAVLDICFLVSRLDIHSLETANLPSFNSSLSSFLDLQCQVLWSLEIHEVKVGRRSCVQRTRYPEFQRLSGKGKKRAAVNETHCQRCIMMQMQSIGHSPESFVHLTLHCLHNVPGQQTWCQSHLTSMLPSCEYAISDRSSERTLCPLEVSNSTLRPRSYWVRHSTIIGTLNRFLWML